MKLGQIISILFILAGVKNYVIWFKHEFEIQRLQNEQ